MSSLDERETGSIKWYTPTKGYGFIKPDGFHGYSELFFHRSAIVPGWEPMDLSPGGDVEYSVEFDEVGRLRAAQVTRPEGPCFGCRKEGHRVKDCKDTPPGPAVFCSRCGKWGHKARGCGKACYDCGRIGHISVDCPRKQGPSSLTSSNVGWDEISEEPEPCGQTDAGPGLPHGGGSASSDNEDGDNCVILESNPFVSRDKQSDFSWIIERIQRRIKEQNMTFNSVNILSKINSDTTFKLEEDNDVDGSIDDCVVLENYQEEDDDNDDCIVLDKNPFEEDIKETITNISTKLTLSCDSGTVLSCQQSSHPELQSLQEGLDHEELVVVAERGEVACRDFPHSRHLCAKYPFKNTKHQTYCYLCYCYVCDTRAPCKYWEAEPDGHCHASEQEFKWIEMRVINRTTCP